MMDGTTAATSSAPASPPSADAPLALVCGGGAVPAVVAAAVVRSGRKVVLFPVQGWATPETVAAYSHHWIKLGQIGRFAALARAEGCRDIVVIGTVLRPAMRDIRLDWTTLRLLPRIAGLFRGGDDRLLTGVGRILEEQGFRLVGAHEVAPDILVPPGVLTRTRPSARDESDIARGSAALAALGPFDVGQAAIVADGYIVAIEAAEGTDAMLARVADLRRAGRLRTPPGVGVLVKAPKGGQDRRFDLPSIGPRTIEGVAAAGLAGIAVVAGGAIMAEPDQLVAAADRNRLFVLGIGTGEGAR